MSKIKKCVAPSMQAAWDELNKYLLSKPVLSNRHSKAAGVPVYISFAPLESRCPNVFITEYTNRLVDAIYDTTITINIMGTTSQSKPQAAIAI